MLADHAGNLLHGFDLGAHHVDTPLLEHLGDDVDLLAIEDVTQLLAIEPGLGGALGRDVGNERVEIGTLRHAQPIAVLEQCPAQALEVRVGLLFEPPRLCPEQTMPERQRGICRR